MDASSFVGLVFTKFKGKAKSKAPSSGDAKFTMYLDIAYEKICDWIDDVSANPKKYRRPFDSAISSTYVTLPTDFARFADSEIYAGDKKLTYLDFSERKKDIDGVYEDDDKLHFTKPSAHQGETLTSAILFYPPRPTSSDYEVNCDSMNWLILATAADIAFNDPQKQDNYPDLFGRADAAYKKMLKKGRTKTRGSARRVRRGNNPVLGRTW